VIDRYVSRIIIRPDSIDVELNEPLWPRRLRSQPMHRLPPPMHYPPAPRSSACLGARWRSLPSKESCIGPRPTRRSKERPGTPFYSPSPRRAPGSTASHRAAFDSFDEIAEREGKVERHIRLLTPLAFIPPHTMSAIIEGTGRHDATMTALAQEVPYRWDRSPAGQVSEQSSDGGRRYGHLQARNRLVVGLSPTSPTTQSRVNPVSCGLWQAPRRGRGDLCAYFRP
jgi:hypothetical protein